jgi:hypothetical protein
MRHGVGASWLYISNKDDMRGCGWAENSYRIFCVLFSSFNLLSSDRSHHVASKHDVSRRSSIVWIQQLVSEPGGTFRGGERLQRKKKQAVHLDTQRARQNEV